MLPLELATTTGVEDGAEIALCERRQFIQRYVNYEGEDEDDEDGAAGIERVARRTARS